MPVLLLHGYTDNSRSWSLLAPHLAGRRLIALDLRGHGGSAAPACCYGIDSLAQDVDGFLAALNIDKADVIGHSLGSMTAATLAAYHPARVDQLVLVSTAASVPKAGSDWLWDNVPKLSHPIDPNSEFMLAWYWNPTPVAEDFLSRERAESAAVPAQVWMGALKALTLTDWSPLAPRITAPTLVLWGDQDSLFDAASQTRVKELLPTARHETFTGLGQAWSDGTGQAYQRGGVQRDQARDAVGALLDECAGLRGAGVVDEDADAGVITQARFDRRQVAELSQVCLQHLNGNPVFAV